MGPDSPSLRRKRLPSGEAPAGLVGSDSQPRSNDNKSGS